MCFVCKMPKTRKDEGLGDWSSTGTFLRKPTTGWLHEDHELCNQSSINYRIQVMTSRMIYTVYMYIRIVKNVTTLAILYLQEIATCTPTIV